MISIFYKGIREGTISVSQNTFYKINRIYGFRPPAKKRKKRKYPEGLRSKRANQIWHVDITKVKTQDGQIHDVQIIVDNYSKFILAAELVNSANGENTVKNLRKAYLKAKSTGRRLNVKLIADGGPENENFEVKDFIKESKINIEKFTARKDTKKSNSMVERVNRDFKQGYIYPRDLEDAKMLKRLLQYFISDYNFNKPHASLNGSTPYESWTDNEFPIHKSKKRIKTVRKRRIEINKSQVCITCKG